jgi:hypothetical protein
VADLARDGHRAPASASLRLIYEQTRLDHISTWRRIWKP